MTRFVLCRKLNADIWGELLYTSKSLRLIKKVYRPQEKRSTRFVVRIDHLVPANVKRPVSNFSLGKLDKGKFEAFYDYTPKNLRHIISRQKGLRQDIKVALLTFLESQLHIILWRTQLFQLQVDAKRFIIRGNVMVNPITFYEYPKRSPGFRVSKFDFIILKRNINLRHFYHLQQVNLFQLREYHLLIDYETFAIFYLENPNPELIFHFFSFEFANILFTPRYY